MRVLALDAPHSMIWGTPAEMTWAWLLEPRPDGSTRVISRVRSRYRWLSPSIVFPMLVEFTDIWMMRKMLLNIRERAEATIGTACSPEETAPAAVTDAAVLPT